MQLSDYITVFKNIYTNFSYLRYDFLGFGLNIGGIVDFLLNVLFAVILILTYYLIGEKIRWFFFKQINCKNLVGLISIALGYILVNSGLGILGLFSLFKPLILWMYIVAICIASILPFHTLGKRMQALGEIFEQTTERAKKNKWLFVGTFLFVFIAFLRLIPPEIGEDAIGYHTSDPHLFLKNHTIMLSDSYVALPAPHLGEMSYALSEFVGLKDSTRYVHFSFYFLVILLLININPYSALFFVTAPVVIQISSKANVDFQWILLWLLAILILVQSRIKGTKSIVLAGVLFGGVIASKLWTMGFFPVFLLCLLVSNRKLKISTIFNIVCIFFLSAIVVDSIWLWRSYVISDNPLYPVFSGLGIGSVLGFNELMFHMQNIIVFSPLFFLAIVTFLLHWQSTLKFLRRFNLFLFFALLATEYIFVKYHFGRYLLGLYSLAVIVIAESVKNVINKYTVYKVVLITVFSIMFTYYFLNTLMLLPYGLGCADSNKYLTRIIARDNANYYDFNHLFDKWISNNDKVATYGIYGYYYANFDYVDVNNVFKDSSKSFDLLSKKNITRLFIKGGDLHWFCVELKLTNCDSGNEKLLAEFHQGISNYYLYDISKAR